MYTIAQMLDSAVMCFFKHRSSDGDWGNLELKEEDIIFCVFVGNIVLQRLCVENISPDRVKPLDNYEQRYWIRPKLNFSGGYPFQGGDMIEIDFSSGKGASSSRVVKANLDPFDPIVKELELTSMWGYEDLRERLIKFFDTGIDENPIKNKVFGFTAGKPHSN